MSEYREPLRYSRRVRSGIREFHVYVLGNLSGTLYTGITNDLERRTLEHRFVGKPGFSAKYKTARLLYFEQYSRATDAIQREKEIKGWSRSKKLALIRTMNPCFKDLSGNS